MAPTHLPLPAVLPQSLAKRAYTGTRGQVLQRSMATLPALGVRSRKSQAVQNSAPGQVSNLAMGLPMHLILSVLEVVMRMDDQRGEAHHRGIRLA
jgi:hypothetical protein